MAEQDANRDESLDPDEPAAEAVAPGRAREQDGGADGAPEFDEEAAWAAIVAGYGEEPPDPPGAKPFKSVEDLALLDPEPNDAPQRPRTDAPSEGTRDGGSVGDSAHSRDGADGADGGDSGDGDGKSGKSEKRGEKRKPDAGRPAGGSGAPLGGSVSFAPGVGPRDFTPSASSDDDFDADDEGHFVPPDPPPLPSPDVTARFAWLAVVGGPVLMLLAVLLGWSMTWWLATLGVGGFVGGFVTLVVRMGADDDEDHDDPGRGAVV